MSLINLTRKSLPVYHPVDALTVVCDCVGAPTFCFKRKARNSRIEDLILSRRLEKSKLLFDLPSVKGNQVFLYLGIGRLQAFFNAYNPHSASLVRQQHNKTGATLYTRSTSGGISVQSSLITMQLQGGEGTHESCSRSLPSLTITR